VIDVAACAEKTIPNGVVFFLAITREAPFDRVFRAMTVSATKVSELSREVWRVAGHP